MTGQDNDSIQEKLLWCLRSINMLHETLLETNAQQGIGALLQAIVRRAAELVGAQIGLMFLIRPDGESMELAAESTPDMGYLGRVYSIHEGLCGTVARTGEPFAVEDYMSWDGQVCSSDHPPAGRALAVPLKMGNQIIGVLFVGDKFKVGKFSDEESQLINMFAEQATLALQNAQLHDAMRREIAERTAQLEAANRALQADIAACEQAEALLRIQRDIGVMLSSSDDLQTALQRCLEMIAETRRFQAGVIHVLDEQSKTLNLIAEVGMPDWARAHVLSLGEGSFEMDAITAGEPVYLNDAQSSSLFTERFKRFGSLSAAAIPIHHEGKAIASLSVVSQHHREIDAGSRLVLESVAAQIGGAIVRLHAEDAVKRNQENLQNLFDAMDDFLFVVDMQGRIAHVNPIVRERLGYSQDELIGRYGPELISPREWQRVGPSIRSIAEGQPESYAVSLIPKEGKNIPVDAHGLRGHWDGRDVIFCVGRDVAEHVEFETLLRNQRDLTTALSSIDNLDEALRYSLDAAMQIEGLDAGCIYLVDPNTGVMELRARRNLPEWFVEGMYRMGPEISRDHPLFRHTSVYLEDGKDLPFSGGKVRRAGFRAIASVPVVHEGKITALIILTSLTLDVLPAKSRHALESIAAQIGGAIVRLQAEAERDEQRRMLRTLLDTLPGFVVFKDRDSMYRMCNQKVCDFWRMSEEEMIGKTDSDLLPPEDAIICRQEELYVMSTREILTADHKLAGPDGTVYWHESIKVPLQNEQGEIIGVLITDWDITERREVEAERDEQRRMVQAMLATTPDIVTFKDRSMAFKITSESFRRLMAPDRTADELVGCSDFDVFPQELAQRYLGEEVEVLMSGKTVIAEHQVETCEGSRWLEAIKMPLRDENGEIVGIFTSERDITERRRAENERDEQRRMLRTLLDAMPDVVLFKDKDLRYVVANKKYCDMYGLSEKELVGKTDFEVMLLADDAERFRREDLRVLEGETVLERHECQTPWGPRWDESIRVPLRDDRGEIIGVVVAARDITERIHMEEDRDAQQRMLRALLDHLPHHILFKDRDLVYRVINQGYCDFFERPMGQLIGATDLDVWPEEDAHHYMEGERRLLETGEPIRMEKFTETRWGPNWREVIKNPLRDSAGNIIGILVAAHDITALKLADKQLRRRNEELSALNAISTAINQSLEPEFILKTALTEVLALDMIGAEGRGEVFLITQEGEALLIAQHGLPQAYLDNAELRGKYLCNLVQQHEHVVISDGETYEEGDVHGAGNLPHCNLSLLLRSRERVLGCINLWLPASKTLAQDDFLFLNSISDRISMAVENAHLYEDVTQQNLQIRALSRQVIENSEDERKRIAQDLHDMTGQYLTALGINLNIIKQNLTPDMWDKTMPRLEDCTNLVERTTDYIRGVMADLRPPALDDYGLFAALMWLRDRFVKQADIQIDFIGQPLSERLAPHMEITLFRIAQEALTNVMKHAKASRVEVTLEESDGLIVLQVKDNGVGFDSTQPVTPSEKGGWGLLSIKEWMSGFGGIFEVKSAPGEGTLLRVEWPRQ